MADQLPDDLLPLVSESAPPLRMRRLLIVLQAVFAVVFVLLVYSNFVLRKQLTEAKAALQSGARPHIPLVSGQLLPPVRVRDRTDRSSVLDGKTERNRLVILVHPRCEYCKAVLHDISAHPVTTVDVVSLAPRKLSARVVDGIPAEVPLYFVDRIESTPLAHHAVVPQILRIDAAGRITVCSSYTVCAAATPAAGQCATCGT